MSIKVENVSKLYNTQKAVQNVSFEIEKGEVVGLLGPNGSGKSTLMKIITGFITSFQGDVLIEGVSVKKNLLAIQKNIGYLPESNPLYQEMYVLEYLTFVAEVHKIPKKEIKNVLDAVGLTQEAHKQIYKLSKGYKQRVGLAAALIHNPKILILDEPTTGLDPNQLIEIRDLIRQLGENKIIILSTHIMQEVEAVCDRVLILKNGEIVADENLKKLKEQQMQIIEVEFDFQIEKRFFNQLPDLQSLTSLGGAVWELTFDTKEDMRSKVFDFATENGLKIIQLNTKNKNLESLFTELTN
ncbi:gliding motility-associated ABC transporter ATP-binding subunit GldA [Flavicella sp.]|uniref:gliding motility-associated ABC transporter ATP-binding subunit GldA n=1 Tax=Flavicella sp. TaxID=2957742 RepID=UPI0030182F83